MISTYERITSNGWLEDWKKAWRDGWLEGWREGVFESRRENALILLEAKFGVLGP